MSGEEQFRIVVLGDSIQWGQGLLEEEKFSELVRQVVEKELGRPAVLVHRYARSGASIGREGDEIDGTGHATAGNFDPGSLLGELPGGTPTVHGQLNALLLDPTIDRNRIDLVLVDGGINPDQTGGSEATDPFGKVLYPLTPPEALRDDTTKACYERMRGLLQRITAGLPNARVVVTGYYPIFSLSTDLLRAIPWLQFAVAVLIPMTLLEEALLHRLAELSQLWAETSADALRRAVDETNQSLGGARRVGYAHVHFGSENSLLASRSWLWGLSPLLHPEDSVAQERLQLCQDYGRAKDLFSVWASIGHPNREGARQYSRAIVRTLRELGVLHKEPSPLAPWLGKIADIMDRLRPGGGG